MSGKPGSEDAAVEQPALALLAELGWEVLHGFDEPVELGRSSKADVILDARLRDAVQRLNLGLDQGAVDAAVAAFMEDRPSLDPVRANKAVWELLRDGVVVQAEDNRGNKEPRRVRFVAWDVADQNEFLAVSQLWFTGELHTRRTDIVLFVNGIPLGFLELKAPERAVHEAYQGNLRAYRSEIPQLFWFNAFVILSNGSESRMGSTYAPWEFFAEWKKIDDEAEAGAVSLETMLRATCEPHRMLDIVENFITYTETGGTFGNDGESVYDYATVAVPSRVATLPKTEQDVTDADVEQADAERFARIIEEIYGTRETWALSIDRLMAGEESDVVEFKTSARWDTDGQVTKKAPAVITKTIAGFANANGGTLLIGVNDKGEAVGLRPDYQTFSDRQDIDKWLNWLTDIIINHLGRGVLRRLRVRIHLVDGNEICRIDIPALSAPTWSAAGKGDPLLYERLPNSTRAVPADEVEDFLAGRFRNEGPEA